MQCLINKGFCLHLLINFLSHLRHFTLTALPLRIISAKVAAGFVKRQIPDGKPYGKSSSIYMECISHP